MVLRVPSASAAVRYRTRSFRSDCAGSMVRGGEVAVLVGGGAAHHRERTPALGRSDMRRLLTLAAASVGVLAFCVPASAAPLVIGDPSTASDESPFAPGCGGPDEAVSSSVNYLNAEVESHVADDPTDADTLAGAWQQDRWNDGGAHGNVHAYSTDGGETWTASSPLFSRCAGGTATSAVQGTTVRRGRATTSGRRTHGCPMGRVVVCTRSRSCSTTRRRATRSWPPTPTTTARPGALRASCASTIRARSATTSTTRRR